MNPLDYLATLARGIKGSVLDTTSGTVPELVVTAKGRTVRVWHAPPGAWTRAYPQHAGVWEVVVEFDGDPFPRTVEFPATPTPPTLARIYELLGEPPPRSLVPRPRRRPRPQQLALFGGAA